MRSQKGATEEWGQRKGHGGLGSWGTNFYCKGLDSNYFRLCRPCSSLFCLFVCFHLQPFKKYKPFLAPGCCWIWSAGYSLPTPDLEKSLVNLTILPESDPALLSKTGHLPQTRALQGIGGSLWWGEGRNVLTLVMHLEIWVRYVPLGCYRTNSFWQPQSLLWGLSCHAQLHTWATLQDLCSMPHSIWELMPKTVLQSNDTQYYSISEKVE